MNKINNNERVYNIFLMVTVFILVCNIDGYKDFIYGWTVGLAFMVTGNLLYREYRNFKIRRNISQLKHELVDFRKELTHEQTKR